MSRRRVPPRAGIALLAGLGALSLAAACGSADPKPVAGAAAVTIMLTNDGCAPAPDTVPAGPVTFTVTNQGGDKVSEAELLSGDKIVGEKENLTPGLSGSFSLNLKAGSYTIACPGASTEKSPFTVTGSAGVTALSPGAAAKLDSAVAGYATYVKDKVARLVPATKAFTDAVRAGDMAEAQALFAPARAYYEQIEPVAESFGDLDPRIDARINDVDDPASWTGFHRIEKALWEDKSLTGMTPIANKLDADIAKLAALVDSTTYQPAQLANGATELLNEVASSKITGEEDRYSHTDLSDFQANIDGAKSAFDLLGPALRELDPTLYTQVAQRFSDVLAALRPFKGSYAGSGFVNYSTVDGDQRRVLTQRVDALAEPLSRVASQVTG